MAKLGASVAVFAMLVLLSAGLAQAGTGVLKGSFQYRDPSTGAVQGLDYGFIYLHSTAKPPPMEKFFSKADYILGATASDGTFSVSVPEGSYYLRILRRKVVGGTRAQFGPPGDGDLTWFQTAPVTITAGSTVDLGTVYATTFMIAPIRITGTMRTQTGAPLPGYYLRAQTEPCIEDGANDDVNQCGPTKYLTQQPTDANGQYTLYLREAGTYYFYVSPCITASYYQYTGNRCKITTGPGPVVLSLGDSKIFDFKIWQ